MRSGFRRSALATALLAVVLFAPDLAHAAPWCGTTSPTDRPAAATGHPVRVVYAIPADGADRSAELAPLIWADVEQIDAWWRANDPTRTLNFDLFPFSCGLQVDLAVRRLTHASAALAAPATRFDRIRDDLYGPGAFEGVFSKYLVYYDGPTDDAALCGEGGGGVRGTGLAVVYLHSCTSVPKAHVAAHELMHALGALRLVLSPNACPGDTSHVCDSPTDILFPVAQQPQPLSSFVLDFGRNDYYGHGHPWFDVQDSLWLRHLDANALLSVGLRGRGTVRSDVPGVACSASCRTAWNPGSAVRLTAVPAPGQRFVRWSGGCFWQDPRCDLLVDADAASSVTALFAPSRYRLAVQVAGRGRVAGAGLTCAVARCTRNVESHRNVTLRATPAKGWRLKAWTGACRGVKVACVVPMKTATSVRATFVRRATT